METSRLLIDGDVLCYRTCHAVQTDVQWDDDIVTSATNLDELMAAADGSIKYWQNKLEVENVLVAFSDKRSEYFRHDILPEYKANRKAHKKPLGYTFLKNYICDMYITLLIPRLEADDVLGILATDGTYDRNIIVSIDKDMLTIPGEYFNMDTEVTENIPENLANYMFYFQTLVGDSTDNYKGCPGVGPVKAREILMKKSKENGWERIVKAFEKAKLTEEDALVQARVARILRSSDYNFEKMEVKLWSPI